MDESGSEPQQQGSRAGVRTLTQDLLSNARGLSAQHRNRPELSGPSMGSLFFPSLSPSVAHLPLPGRGGMAAGSQALALRAAAILHT